MLAEVRGSMRREFAVFAFQELSGVFPAVFCEILLVLAAVVAVVAFVRSKAVANVQQGQIKQFFLGI